MREFLDRHYVVKAFVALALFMVISLGIKFGLKAAGIEFVSNAEYFVREILLKVVPIVGVALVFHVTGSMKRFTVKSFFMSLVSGLAFVIYSVAGVATCLYLGPDEGEVYKGAVEIIFYILFVLAIGFSEELLFRGAIPDIVRGCEIGDVDAPDYKKRNRLAAIVSSFLFGFIHITNLLNGQGVVDTTCQIMYAACIGFVFYAIYNKQKNLYGVAFIHALVDLFGIWWDAMFVGHSVGDTHADSDATNILGNLVLCAILMFIALIIYLPKRKILRKIFKKKDKPAVEQVV